MTSGVVSSTPRLASDGGIIVRRGQAIILGSRLVIGDQKSQKDKDRVVRPLLHKVNMINMNSPRRHRYF